VEDTRVTLHDPLAATKGHQVATNRCHALTVIRGAYLADRKPFPFNKRNVVSPGLRNRSHGRDDFPMTLNSTKNAVRTATTRALVGAILALGALGGLAVGEATAMPGPTMPLTPSIPIPPPSPAESSSGSQSSATSVNDIKIGNRSQLSQSAADSAPPNQQTSAGRPQTLVFKIGRFVIGR
jgi:hypothetical protein